MSLFEFKKPTESDIQKGKSIVNIIFIALGVFLIFYFVRSFYNEDANKKENNAAQTKCQPTFIEESDFNTLYNEWLFKDVKQFIEKYKGEKRLTASGYYFTFCNLIRKKDVAYENQLSYTDLWVEYSEKDGKIIDFKVGEVNNNFDCRCEELNN